MNVKEVIRKIAAALLLLLFGFILLEKAVHNHEVQHSEYSNPTVVQKQVDCKICEFQLITDTDIMVYPFASSLISFSHYFSSVISEGYAAPLTLIHAERGPPTLR